jgi:hypothetical protein
MLWCLPIAVQAETGGVAVLPQGAKPKNKVQIILDTRWVDANGYRPIRVTVVQWPGGKAPADRQFRITFSGDTYGSRADMTVTDVIDLPEGQASATKTIPFPQCGQSWRFHVTVREDGVELREMEADLSFPNRYGYGNWSESTPALLFLDRDAPSPDQQQLIVEQLKRTGTTTNPGEEARLPDLRNISLVFPDPNGGVRGQPVNPDAAPSDRLVISLLSEAPRQRLSTPREMPKRWIEWTCFDAAFISLDDLQAMHANPGNPEQFASLDNWLRAGGTLCVYGTGEKYARVKELEAALSISEQSTASTDLAHPSVAEGRGEKAGDGEGRTDKLPSLWIPPHKMDFGQGLRSQSELANGNAYAYAGATTMARATPAAKGLPTPDVPLTKDPPHLVRWVGFGKLVVFAKDNPFPGEVGQWQAVFNSIGAEHWMWYRRHGMSLTRNNDSYWQFLIPGVGKAPVLTFLVLISLFMIVIGPLNYSWLKRRGRLHLLLVTVPAGAALMVGGLFLFAILTDGLSAQTRIRSFTRLDQTNKSAASWSRQTYYASLAPSRGLLFPDSAAVYPLEAEPVSRRGRRAGGRVVEWDDAQRLRAGYIYPRTAAQFLVVNTEPCDARLDVKGTSGSVEVTNHLGSEIPLLLLRDDRGEFFTGSRISAGGSQSLTSLTMQEAFDIWARHMRNDRPELPADWSVSQENLFSWIGGPRYNYWGIDAQAAAASQATSLLERGLTDGDPSKFAARLTPRTYLAATTEPLATPVGLAKARSKASVYVVQGNW